MKYIMPCLLKPPVVEYHRTLVDDIADRFGLTFTRQQAIPAHFTLKYHFGSADIQAVEDLLEQFARTQSRTPITVGGFGHFDEDVVFVEVSLSQAALRSLEALTAALRTVPRMPWSPFDAERLHPHMTIAERCRPRFAELWSYLEPFERRFTTWLDNVTVLRKTGERDGMDFWTVHRTFELEA
jgi:2'-5' RNA ligase